MNLLHHLVVAENLRERLSLPQRVRGAMLLGAIAPDAHAEMSGIDRSMLHPPSGDGAVGFVMERLKPPSCLEATEGRAFAISCVGHLVADEMTRSNTYHLPPHAPTGFQPLAEPTDETHGGAVIDVAALTRDLMRAEMPCLLGPLTSDAVDSKRWEVLARYPLVEGEGLFLVVEPLASVSQACAVETLTRLVRSDHAVKLLEGSRRK